MSDHQDAAEVLRRAAAMLEDNLDLEMKGELVLSRWVSPTRKEIDEWVRNPIYVDPMHQDRTQTTRLSFTIESEKP